jgi:hypothetical protein
MSDRVDDVINNPAYDMLGGYHIFLRRMLIPIFIILIALLVWTITEPISSSLTRKVVTAIITGLSLGPVTNFDRGVAEWLRRRNKI